MEVWGGVFGLEVWVLGGASRGGDGAGWGGGKWLLVPAPAGGGEMAVFV